MAAHGYRVIPVNPVIAGQTVVGEVAVPDLSALPTAVDVVNVFRRSDQLAEVWADAAQLPPCTWWTQLDIIDDAVAAAARGAGWRVVQDRCLKIEHARLM